MKATDPFFRIWKKIGPSLSTRVWNQSAFEIVQVDTLTSVKEKVPSRKGEGKVLKYQA